MTRTLGCFQARWALALAAALAVTPAWADDGAMDLRLGNDDNAAYLRAIRDGVAEYDAGHYEEARSLFRRAHELSPNARTYRGMGMTSFELRDYVPAVRNLAAALQDKRKPLTTEQRKETQDLLERSRQFVDVYAIKVVPPEARLIIDGRPPELEPDGTVLLGFGVHTVEAKAPKLAPAWASVEVRGGERKDLVLSLSPLLPVPSGPAAARPSLVERPSATARSSRRAAAAWLWSGAGLAALAGGAGYYWYRQQSELDECRAPAAADMVCTTEGSLVTQRNLGVGATLGLGAAAVTAAVIGIVKWNTLPAKGGVALACTVLPNGAACGGRF